MARWPSSVVKATFEASGTVANIDSPANVSPERDSVETADQLTVTPSFDAVRVPELVQPEIALAKLGGDPGAVLVGARHGRTCVDDLGKGAVCSHMELLLSDQLAQGPRDMR